jgi:hypothetical protein
MHVIYMPLIIYEQRLLSNDLTEGIFRKVILNNISVSINKGRHS